MTVLGFDASNNNGKIDFADIRTNGTRRFGIFKATEGTSFTDPDFATNYADAKSIGLIRGAYHFARPSQGDGAKQASIFNNFVAQRGGGFDLPPVLDLEDSGGLSAENLQAWARDFGNLLYQTCGKRPILYADTYFCETFELNTLSSLFDLWIADYTQAKAPDIAKFPNWLFWQQTNEGVLSGVPGHADLDTFNGTYAELQKLAGNPDLPTTTVYVKGHPYPAVIIGGVTHVSAGALAEYGTKTAAGELTYKGLTYVPWDELAEKVTAEKVWQFT